MQYRISYACISHPGKVRRINQDNFICNGQYMTTEEQDRIFPIVGSCSSSEDALFGVFDGLGGGQFGEVASQIAAQCAVDLQMQGGAMERLKKICLEANQKICDFSAQQGVTTAGTTAAMLLFTKKIFLCNIGDSKIYRFRRGSLDQISVDHICPAPFGVKPHLSQCLGIPAETIRIEPFYLKDKYVHEDIYVACSDGLTDMLQIEEIKSILVSAPIEEAVVRLCKQSIEKGGHDNITIILCKIEKEPRRLFQRKPLWKREV